MKIRTYTSDGSDGHSADTCGYVITAFTSGGVELMWFDGGYCSREHAYAFAQKQAASIRRSGQLDEDN